MADTVKVGCRMANGVVLNVYDRVDSIEEPGKKMLRHVGLVTLPGPIAQHGERPGMPPSETVTDVDARLFGLWMRDNEGSDLVTSGYVYKVEPPKVDPAPKEAKVESADKPVEAKK